MIEISLAILIIGIAMVSIMGLLVAGLQVGQDASDDNMAAMIVQSIVADRGSTPYAQTTPPLGPTTFAIPSLDASSFPYNLYFKKTGGTPTNSYLVSWLPYYEATMYATNFTPGLCFFDIRVSWPANASLTNRTTYFYTTVFSNH